VLRELAVRSYRRVRVYHPQPKKEEDKKDAKEDSGSDIDDDDPEVLAIAEQLRAKRIAAAEKKGNFDAQAMPTGSLPLCCCLLCRHSLRC
jgi:hypothetical protein